MKDAKSKYNPDWEDASLYPDNAPWIQRIRTGSADDAHFFGCKVCPGSIKAVKSHMTDKKLGVLCKHNKNMKSRNISMKLSLFAPASPPTPVTSSAAASGPTVNDASNDIVIEVAPVPVVDEGSVGRSKQSIRHDNASGQVVRIGHCPFTSLLNQREQGKVV